MSFGLPEMTRMPRHFCHFADLRKGYRDAERISRRDLKNKYPDRGSGPDSHGSGPHPDILHFIEAPIFSIFPIPPFISLFHACLPGRPAGRTAGPVICNFPVHAGHDALEILSIYT